MPSTRTSSRSTARRAGDHPVVTAGARLGYAANGVLHLLIGWLALQLAWGGSSGEADQGGALRMLAGTPVGGALLWVVAAGFALLALWQLLEAAVEPELGDRLKHLGKAVLYAALTATAVTVVQGASSSGSGSSAGVTARVMEQPWGPALMVVAGLGVLVVAGYHVVKGWTSGFLSDLEGHPGTWAERLGRIGYIAKGVALAVVGVLLALVPRAGSEEAPGLDGALRTVVELPFGPYLLTLVALGLAAYGLYSFARARYAEV